MQDGSEGEVASYVLAYLLQHKYKNTANAFLRECQQLPSKSLIVLPEIPLTTIIAQHRAHQNAKVLVNTLGGERAWQELWGKLHTTLSQIRCVSEELNTHQQSKVKASKIVCENACQSVSGDAAVTLSPHKRKQGPRRKILQSAASAEGVRMLITPPLGSSSVSMPPSAASTSMSVASTSMSVASTSMSAASTSMSVASTSMSVASTSMSVASTSKTVAHSGSSPTMQQVLDAFLDDQTFPSKLADIINQCVTSDEGKSELSSNISTETLEHILSATLSEPSLEGVLPSSVSSHIPSPVSTPRGGVASSAGEVASSSYGGGLLSNSRPVEVKVLAKSSSGASLATPTQVTYSSALSPAIDGFQDVLSLARKRPRMEVTPTSSTSLDFPTEQDIDSFLDQIHQ